MTLRNIGLRAGIAAAIAFAGISAVSAEPLVGLTNTNSVFTVDTAAPNSVNLPLIGLSGFVGSAAESAISLDFRPIGGTPLTVLTTETVGAVTTARLYDLNLTTGLLTGARTLSGVTFSGTAQYTIDFNPTGAAALRIVGSNGDNFAVTNPLTGTTAAQTTLSGAVTNASGVAYTNNDNNAGTGTQLFYVDRADSQLANTADPTTGVTNPVGGLGVTLSTTGFQEIDISGSGAAFGAFQLSGENFSRFYSLNLGNGAATAIGADNRFLAGPDALIVRGIALAPAVVPESGTLALLGMGATVLGGLVIRRRRK